MQGTWIGYGYSIWLVVCRCPVGAGLWCSLDREVFEGFLIKTKLKVLLIRSNV